MDFIIRMEWWIWLLIIIVVLIVLFILFIIFCCWYDKRKLVSFGCFWLIFDLCSLPDSCLTL